MPVLPGIPKLSFAANERFSPIGALKAASEGLQQEEAAYSLLMGVSGAAFRLAWSPDWALDMANVVPEDVVRNGAEWLGLGTESRLHDALDDAWDRVRGSIDAGMPVLSCGLAGAPEFCVIAGYEPSPRRFYVRTYFDRAEGDAYAEVDVRPWQGWNHLGFGTNPTVVLARGPEPDRGRLLTLALSRALEFSKIGRRESHGKTHYFGHAAYDAWLDSLANLDPSGDLGLKAWSVAVNLSALADARRAAADFLRIVAAMKPAWSRALRRAAEHYDHLVNVLAKAQPIMEFPLDVPERAAELAAANLADPRRRSLLSKFVWTAKQEDEEALGWIHATLHGD